MKKQKTLVQFFPYRLFYIFPIFIIMAEFEDQLVSATFGVCLSYFTGRMFPMIEHRLVELPLSNRDEK